MRFLSVFAFFLMSAHTMHHKMVIVNGEIGCVEALVSGKTASRFGGEIGACLDVGCDAYRGVVYVPLIGNVRGFGC